MSRLFLGVKRALEFGAVLDGVLQRVLGRFEGGGEFGLLLPDAGGLAFQFLGVAAAPLLDGFGARAADPGVGEADGAADAFGELGEGVPGVLGALEARREAAYLAFEGGLAALGGLEFGLGGVAAPLQFGLVGDLGAERAGEGDEVVGEEAEPGVAQVGLDDGGAPGDGGLAAEGFELAAQFLGEVLDAGQVGLHGVEFPQRLLLALAVFEDARRLLDEGAPSHGVGVEHGVELALADDDVHLPADSGIREEFLDVEEPAGVAVDLVFAAAVAEHDPRDGDLGVFDGQRAVGVVDGEGDLGPAQRGPPGRSGEDDVFHLPAAQGFGALFAHDPGERVDHIGFTGAVRAHDAGDPGLETQGRGGGEGFESAQGHGLEVHAVGLYRPPVGPGGCGGESPGCGPAVSRCEAPGRSDGNDGAADTAIL